MEKKENELILRIEQYIIESQDANFDRYLEQMKQIVIAEPERAAEIERAVEQNIQRYRRNIRKKQTNSVEFKIGAGVLSGIGILFVLIALMMLVRNFMPGAVQGMMMLAFFAVIWLAAQLGISRLSQKLALGISCAGIAGLYLSAALNYYTFEALPRAGALAIMVLTGIISWIVGSVMKSAVIQYASFGGYLLFALILPWGDSLPEYIASLVLLACLNLMWQLGAAGEQRRLVQLVHMICYEIHAVIYGGILCLNQSGTDFTKVLIFGMLAALLLNIFYLKKEGTGFFCVWLSGGIYLTIFITVILIVEAALWESTAYALLLLALPLANLILLFMEKFQRRVQGIHYQSVLLTFQLTFLLAIACADFPWYLPGLILGLALLGIGMWTIREGKLANEIVLSVYAFLGCHILLPDRVAVPGVLAALLAITLLCLYVPSLRGRHEAALVYTNISLMGASLLIRLDMFWWRRDAAAYVSYICVLVLAVAAVLLLWRGRCHLPDSMQFFVLTAVLVYMIFVFRLQLPVAVSIVLMALAILAIIIGFVRWKLSLRVFGLCLSLFVCAKVFFYDFIGLELFERSLLFLAVGLIAIAISLIYAVLEVKQRKERERQEYVYPVNQNIFRKEGNSMNIGVNFFGPKKKLYHDFAGTLERLKQSGIMEAEICVAFQGRMEPPKELELVLTQEQIQEMSGGIWEYNVARERLAKVREAGFTVVSTHVMGDSGEPEKLLAMLPMMQEFGRDTGMKYFVISLMKDLSSIKPFAPVLQQMAGELAKDGMALVYHNHEIECMPEDGTTALAYLMEQCPDLKLELDVGWAKFAGEDPVELMKKYGDRLVLLHFKDIRSDACPENRDTCFTAVGEGSIPLREILANRNACSALDEWGLIIDQDDSPTDILVDLDKGARNIIAAAE